MVTRNRFGDVAVDAAGVVANHQSGASPDWDEFQPVGEYCPLNYSECSESHDFERDIQRRLLETPGLHFSSLVVRRLDDGICVQGVLEMTGPHLDIGKIVRDVSGVENVVNQVLVRQSEELAAEC
jgi:hypothetical protein